jgi:hypothetical protein
MSLFGHHAKAFLEIEVMGHDLMPDTATEHALFFAVAGVVLFLFAYGAYALVRDLFRWRRRAA